MFSFPEALVIFLFGYFLGNAIGILETRDVYTRFLVVNDYDYDHNNILHGFLNRSCIGVLLMGIALPIVCIA